MRAGHWVAHMRLCLRPACSFDTADLCRSLCGMDSSMDGLPWFDRNGFWVHNANVAIPFDSGPSSATPVTIRQKSTFMDRSDTHLIERELRWTRLLPTICSTTRLTGASSMLSYPTGETASATPECLSSR